MNKDNAHLYIPLLDCLSRGELQMNLGSLDSPRWVKVEADVIFNLAPAFYRKTPSVREYYGVDYGGGDFGYFSETQSEAEERLINANASCGNGTARPRGIAKITVQPL